MCPSVATVVLYSLAILEHASVTDLSVGLHLHHAPFATLLAPGVEVAAMARLALLRTYQTRHKAMMPSFRPPEGIVPPVEGVHPCDTMPWMKAE